MRLGDYEELERRALSPPDLRRVLSSQRVSQMVAAALGIKLSYATERVDEHILHELDLLARKEALIDQMEAMQSGKLMGRNGRRVLHTAMRDLFEERERSSFEEEALAFELKEIEKLRLVMGELEGFSDLVQIGIGGSSLGPKAIYLGLDAYSIKGRRVHFLSNLDPDPLSSLLKEINLRTSLFLVVSKSGSTLETVTNEAIVREHLQRAGVNPRDHCIAVTEQGSSMERNQSYRASFYIHPAVGGRYSVTSMVGGILLSFALGIDNFLLFLRGASAMDRVALNRNLMDNLPLLSALFSVWNRNFLGYPTVAIVPYSHALTHFPSHIQQLDMESSGKRVDRAGSELSCKTGAIIWGGTGTDAQHSFFQLLHQGSDRVPVEFIGFLHSQYGDDFLLDRSYSQEKLLANLMGQAIALAVGQEGENSYQASLGNRPSRILLADKIDPFTLGALLAYYEHKVAFQGFVWGIDSFDQEGVELGKRLASHLLDDFVALRGGVSLGDSLETAYLSLLR